MSVFKLSAKFIFINTVILCLILSVSTAYSVTFHDGLTRMRECTLTIDHTKVGGSANITNYLFRVYRANIPNEVLSPTDNNRCQDDAGDIAFSQGGTQIAGAIYCFEYDSTDGAADAEILLFAEIPTLDFDDNTAIKMHWKAPVRTHQPRYDQTYGWQDCFSTYLAFWPLRNQDPGGHRRYVGLDCTFDGMTVYDSADFHILLSDSNSASGEYAAWPSISKLSTGNLITSYRENGIHNVDADGGIIVRTSANSGATWSAHSTMDNATFDDRDSNIIELDNGDLMLSYCKVPSDDSYRAVEFRIWGGAAWGDAVSISDGSRENCRGKPLYMSNGDILFPLYGENDIDSATDFDVWACVWDPQTATYTDYTICSECVYSEWSVQEDPDTPGTLYGFFRNESDYDIYKSTSTDFGATWSAFSQVLIRTDISSSPMEVQFYTNGDLYAGVSYDRDDNDSRLLRSDDNGATWEADFASIVTGAAIGPAGSGYYESFCFNNRNEISAVIYEDDSATGYANIYYTVANYIGGKLSQYRVRNSADFDDDSTFENGIHWNGSTEYFPVGDATSFNAIHNTGIFSISGWIGLDNYSGSTLGQTFMGSTPSASSDVGFRLAFAGANDNLRLTICDGDAGLIIDSYSETSSIADNNMHYITCTGDATNVVFYIDGVTDAGTNTMGAKKAGNATWSVDIARSNSAGPSAYLDGYLKMIGVRTDCITEGHAQTEYNNESAPATFAIEGAPSSGGFKPPIIMY